MSVDDVLVSTSVRVEEPDLVADRLERTATLIRTLERLGFDVEVRGTIDVSARQHVEPEPAP